jgi:UDP-3-O-[3-hydroxymyristoyl] glucosamine N-acyltransferase
MTDTGTYSIAEIADALSAQAFGNLQLRISRAAEPQSASPEDLAIATRPEYAETLGKGQARAALLWDGADWEAMGLEAAIIPKRPRLAMAPLTRMLDPGQGYPEGIHPSAIIDPTAEIAGNVSIGALTVIAAGARIGSGCIIGPQCYVGWNAVLGDETFLREHVSIGARVRIGRSFIAQPGARVGGDGFSFVTEEKSAVEAVRETLGDQSETDAQGWVRIHSLGSVEIGDNVEIGASTTIDNGTIRNTVIGDGCKMDNLVVIGHNVVMGRDCLICGHSAVAGSTQLGNNVVLGGMSGVSDNITIGDRVITGGGTKVLSSVPAGRVLLGYPATKMDKQIEIVKAQRHLPRFARDIAALKKAVFKSGSED